MSLSTILLMYRVLFRFFTRLRIHLLDPSAAPFRLRNPRTTTTLTSPYAPAVGASLAGLALGVYPSEQLRVSVAIYTMFRALEFGWNCAEENGMVWGWEKGVNGRPDRKRTRPAWWGSWMLQPLAFGQLLHAVVFDRDCFPAVSLLVPWLRVSVLTRWCSLMEISSSSTRRHTSTPSRENILSASGGPRRTRLSTASPRWPVSTGRELTVSFPSSPD